ncbi:MAG: glycosyltransferase family protein [Runella sp.]
MKRVLFLVQGEGRGHLTQAISMFQLLKESDYEVVAVLVGGAEGKTPPSFFVQEIKAPVESFVSPHLIFDQKGNVSFWRTIWYHLPHIFRFLRSLGHLHRLIKHYQPDLIVNFYEILGGFYQLLYRPSIPSVCVGHQYLFFHAAFEFPPNRRWERWLVNFNSRLTALRAKRLLALSFDPLPDIPSRRLYVVPPLLRQDLLHHIPQSGDYLLVYLNHPSFFLQVYDWHLQQPEVRLHCFWNQPSEVSALYNDATLTLHSLDGKKFLEMMAGAKALVTTAGFESISEALYLDKPVLVVPMHYEQACNATDIERVGAGIAATRFDLSVLFRYLPVHQPVGERFREWYEKGSKKWPQHFDEVLGLGPRKLRVGEAADS